MTVVVTIQANWIPRARGCRASDRLGAAPRARHIPRAYPR